MSIDQSILFVTDLIMNTDNKKEKKYYNIFLNIFKSLDKLKLTEKQLSQISQKIDNLDLSSTQDKKAKYLRVKFFEFINFLEKEFSLIEKDHYLSL